MSLSRTAFRAAAQLTTRQPAAAAGLLIPRVLATQQTRSAATSASTSTSTTSAEAYSLLQAQRKLRPIAPHLTIYQPQLTWYMSGANRLTGVMLAGTTYLFGISYAVAPWVGMHMESASIAAAFAALPFAAKIAVKATLAVPFVYHIGSGFRHLLWDTGRALDIPNVYKTGYAVLAATVAGAGYLTFMV